MVPATEPLSKEAFMLIPLMFEAGFLVLVPKEPSF